MSLDRREFAALAALGLAGPLAADDPKPPSLTDAALDALVARCGKHLDDADRTALRARLGGTVGRLASDMKLTWQDEPAFVYAPATEE